MHLAITMRDCHGARDTRTFRGTIAECREILDCLEYRIRHGYFPELTLLRIVTTEENTHNHGGKASVGTITEDKPGH